MKECVMKRQKGLSQSASSYNVSFDSPTSLQQTPDHKIIKSDQIPLKEGADPKSPTCKFIL